MARETASDATYDSIEQSQIRFTYIIRPLRIRPWKQTCLGRGWEGGAGIATENIIFDFDFLILSRKDCVSILPKLNAPGTFSDFCLWG